MKPTDRPEREGTRSPQTPLAGTEKRKAVRRVEPYPVSLQVTTETMDPIRDPVTGEVFFQTSQDDRAVNLSRQGFHLHAECAPSVGTRLFVRLHLPTEERPLEFVGRTRWTRVEMTRGPEGKRAVCGVGVEILGGSRRSLDRYARLLRDLEREDRTPVAPDPTVG